MELVNTMITLHLQVEDDYIETFIQQLPKDKVVIIEEDFKDNQQMFQIQAREYKNSDASFVSYYDSMKELNNWLEQRKKV